MKKSLIAILFTVAASVGLAQTDNTFYAKNFAGGDVGAKIAAAQAACSVNTSILCYIVIDPSLASYAQGTNPTKCSNCNWVDYRTGPPWGSGSGLSGNAGLPAVLQPGGTTAIGADPRSGGTVMAPITSVAQVFTPTTQMPTGTYTKGFSFGDSITAEVGATGGTGTAPYNSNGYAYQVFVNGLGMTPVTLGGHWTNPAIGGDQVCDLVKHVFNSYAPADGDSTIASLMIMLNDADLKGVGGYQATANLCDMAALTWLSIPAADKATGGTATPAANWTTDSTYTQGTALTTTTQNAPQTFSITNTAATSVEPEVFLWFRCWDLGSATTGGVLSAQVDSGAVQFINSFPPVPMATANGATDSVCYADLGQFVGGPTTHTITVKMISATGTVSVIGAGFGPDPNLQLRPLWVGGVTRNYLDLQGEATSSYNEMQRTNVRSLQALGFSGLNFVDTRNYWLSTAATMNTTNPGEHHPNNAGHTLLANAFLGFTASPPSKTHTVPTAPAYREITSGTNCEISPTDELVEFAVGTDFSCTLPQLNGTSFPRTFHLIDSGAGAVTLVGGNGAAGSAINGQIGQFEAADIIATGLNRWGMIGGHPGCTHITTLTLTLSALDVCFYNANSGPTTITLNAVTPAGKIYPIFNLGPSTVGFAGVTSGTAGTNTVGATKTGFLLSLGAGVWNMNTP